MLYISLRRRLLFFFIFLNICIMSAAQTWVPWAGVLAILLSILVVDYLFLDESQFDYDPNYKNWARRHEEL